MDKETKFFFAILHLNEAFFDQYVERSLCLSEKQRDASFCYFVDQYFSALIQGDVIVPQIDPNVPLKCQRKDWFKNRALFKLDNFVEGPLFANI